MTEGDGCFSAEDSSWGFKEFLPLFTLCGGFLVNNTLTITAELHIFPAIVVPEAPVNILASLSSKEGNQASHAFFSNSQVDSSCQVAQKTEVASNQSLDDDDASEEGSEDNATSEEGSKDDATSEEGSEDDATSVEGSDEDDAPKDDVDDEASSLVSNDNARNRNSIDQVKSLEDASQTVENDGRVLNTVASVTDTSNDVSKGIQLVKDTMDVNGFEVVSSKVESVRCIFERHPDIAVDFRAKNQLLRNTCMNFLLSLIETMCQSLEELSNEDLVEADIALTYLKDAGFKVDWLEKKLDQLKENKEKEQCGLARLQEIEENLLKLKQEYSDLDALAEKEKAELSVTRNSMSFDDLVC